MLYGYPYAFDPCFFDLKLIQKHIDATVARVQATQTMGARYVTPMMPGGARIAQAFDSQAKCDQCGNFCIPQYCSRCKSAKYCGRVCQKTAWKTHKAVGPQHFYILHSLVLMLIRVFSFTVMYSICGSHGGTDSSCFIYEYCYGD